MNKKGFTLLEVLAILVLLSAVALIVGRAVLKGMGEAKLEISKTQEKAIERAAEEWSFENTDVLDELDFSSTTLAGAVTHTSDVKACVSVEELYAKGYLEKKDIELASKEDFKGYVIIDFDANNNQYKFRLAQEDKDIEACKKNLVVSE